MTHYAPITPDHRRRVEAVLAAANRASLKVSGWTTPEAADDAARTLRAIAREAGVAASELRIVARQGRAARKAAEAEAAEVERSNAAIRHERGLPEPDTDLTLPPMPDDPGLSAEALPVLAKLRGLFGRAVGGEVTA